MDLTAAFAQKADLTSVHLIAEGLEFTVYRATSAHYGQVVLRIPKHKVFQNVNDPNINAGDLIRQEEEIYNLLSSGPVPVPKAYGYYEIDGQPAMVCEYIDADGTEASTSEIGRVTALIHSTPLPEGAKDMKLVAMEGTNIMDALVKRMTRRFKQFVKAEPNSESWIPGEATLRPIAEQLRRLPDCLLHMDFRDVNFRVRLGRIVAVFDWTNALVGPAIVDVCRILEYGEIPGEEFLAAYKAVRHLEQVSPLEETFLRLDAALMLALVFISEAPNPERRETSIRRVEELSCALQEH
jgi:aminoglycoside phosphotransferase (APT) family kinase protein